MSSASSDGSSEGDECADLFWGSCSSSEDADHQTGKNAPNAAVGIKPVTAVAAGSTASRSPKRQKHSTSNAEGAGSIIPPRVAMRMDKTVGIDAGKANRVIRATTEGGKFWNNEVRKQANAAPKVARAIQALAEARADLKKMDADAFCRARVTSAVKEVDRYTEALEKRRDTSRLFFCIDLDMFYAAVEERDNPKLRGKPMAVGCVSMLSTSNYVARQYGVRAAMPGFVARKLCPELIIVKPRYEAYQEASDATRDVFAVYDADFQAGSLDEAILEVTEAIADRGITVEQLAEEIKKKIVDVTAGLTCSIGCGNTRMLAKMASNVNKPDGFYAVRSTCRAITEFMRAMPLAKVHGIGPVSASHLQAAGFVSVGDLWTHRHLLPRVYKQRTWQYYMRVCMGSFERDDDDDDDDNTAQQRKSISAERTFYPAVPLGDQLAGTLRKIVRELTKRVERKQLRGRSVTVKMKAANFSTKQRCATLPYALVSEQEIYKQAEALLRADMKETPRELRLLGVKISHFEANQTSLPASQSTIDSMFQ